MQRHLRAAQRELHCVICDEPFITRSNDRKLCSRQCADRDLCRQLARQPRKPANKTEAIWTIRFNGVLKDLTKKYGGGDFDIIRSHLLRRATVLIIELEKLETQLGEKEKSSDDLFELYQRGINHLRRTLKKLDGIEDHRPKHTPKREIACAFCGKQLVTNQPHQKFCNALCSAASRSAKIAEAQIAYQAMQELDLLNDNEEENTDVDARDAQR